MTAAGAARAIYQAHLDSVTRAVWSRAFPEAVAELRFPYFMQTPAAEVTMDRPADAMQDMSVFRDQLDEWSVVDYGRSCLVAGFHPTDPDRIDGAHRTVLLRRGAQALPSFVTAMSLRRTGPVWRAEALLLPDVPSGIRFHIPYDALSRDGDEK